MDFTTKRTNRSDASGDRPLAAVPAITPIEAASATEPLPVDVGRGVARPVERRRGLRRSGFAGRVALLAHLGLALFLVTHGVWRGSAAPLMLGVAVPLAQASLIATWAGARPMRSFLRFATAAAGAAWGWFLAIAVLPGIALHSAESAAWAAGLAVQTAVVLAAVSAWRLRRTVLAAVARDDARSTDWRPQYDLTALLAWTAILAVLLGFGRSASGLLGWSGEAGEWANFRFLPIVGAFNALYALCVLFALARRGRIVVRLVAAGLAVAALAWLEPLVLGLLFGTAAGLGRGPALILAAAQAVLVWATLAPMRLVRP